MVTLIKYDPSPTGSTGLLPTGSTKESEEILLTRIDREGSSRHLQCFYDGASPFQTPSVGLMGSRPSGFVEHSI